MDSKVETLVQALLNGDTVDFTPSSRIEAYLKACCNKTGTEGLPAPISRLDALLYQLAEGIAAGGGSSGGAKEGSMKKYMESFTTGGMFTNNSKLIAFEEGAIEFGDTSAVTNMSYMFNFCPALTAVPLFDTSKVTNMNKMFSYCSALTAVPLFDTGKVMDMSEMFSGCSALTAVPLFDTSEVTNMCCMFYCCSALTAVPLFDTSKVTDMSEMFGDCQALTAVPLFDTSKVTDMGYMFSGCSALTTVPAFDTSKVTDMRYMFDYCSALTECWIRNIKVNLQVGSGTTYGHLLTLESLLSLIKELCDTGSSKTLTVGSANLEKLASVYVRQIEITDEMRAEDDLIDEKLPFEVCESTDEGAMLPKDYVLLKNWSLK